MHFKLNLIFHGTADALYCPGAAQLTDYIFISQQPKIPSSQFVVSLDFLARECTRDENACVSRAFITKAKLNGRVVFSLGRSL